MTKKCPLSNKVHSNLASFLLRCKRPINRVQHCRRNNATKLNPLIQPETKLCIHNCNHSHCIHWDPLERFSKDHKLLLECMRLEIFFQMCHFIDYKRLRLSQVLSSYMPYLNESPNLTKAPTLLDFGESLSQRAHKVPADAPGPSQWVILLWCGHRMLLHPFSPSAHYFKIKVSVFSTLSFKTSASH